VDGVYDSDPVKNPAAVLHRRLSFRDVLEKELNVMDETAITLCKENDIPGGWPRLSRALCAPGSLRCTSGRLAGLRCRWAASGYLRELFA
jgi:hypothetical protein